MLDTDAWQTKWAPYFDEIDRKRRRGCRYSTAELVIFRLYRRMIGADTIKTTRNQLAGDTAKRARELLGFDRPRNPDKQMIHRDGVPSNATMSRNKKYVPDEIFRNLARDLFDEARDRYAEEFPHEFNDEASVLYVDGSHLHTRYTCPIRDKNGTVLNDKRVACPDGGYLPPDAKKNKGGHGFSLVPALSRSGLPLLMPVQRIHDSEREVAHQLFATPWNEQIQPLFTQPRLRLLICDGGFHRPQLRADLRKLGIIEIIHLVSHADTPEARKHAAEESKRRIPILRDNEQPEQARWFANGHRELICRCERNTIDRDYGVLKNGSAYARVIGRCKNCGTITITSGEWRRAQNPDRFIRCAPDEADSKRDWLLGNPFTYNDPLATAFGKDRFARNEGFFGILNTQYNLTGKHTRGWFRNKAAAEAEALLAGAAMHLAALDQRRRARSSPANAPPALPAAA